MNLQRTYKSPIVERLAAQGISFVSTEQAMEILGISRATLFDYKQCLNIQEPDGWDAIPNQRGYTLSQLDCLIALRQLVHGLGRKQAQRQINQYLQQEEKDNGGIQ